LNDLLYPKEEKRIIGLTEVRQVVVPCVTIFVGLALISATFSGANGIYDDFDGECSTELDADISGFGVRISIWAQFAVLILLSSFGVFLAGESRIKEVGAGLILTHVSLTIALIVQVHKGTLTSVDAAVGAAIMDAQNVALQIPLASKETLAARWQVLLSTPTQLLGLAFLPVLVIKLDNGEFASEDCRCLYVFWWSRLSDCGDFSGNELSVFWIYHSLRWIIWVHSCFTSMYNAQWFHIADKAARVQILRSDGRKPVRESEALDLKRKDPGRMVKKATIPAGIYTKTTRVRYQFPILCAQCTRSLRWRLRNLQFGTSIFNPARMFIQSVRSSLS
jgi:hypothetical protein